MNRSDGAAGPWRVLLIDDMKLIGAVGRMLEGEPDIAFLYQQDGMQAVPTAMNFSRR